MADRKRLTTISLSLGDELLDAITEAGRTEAVPVTFEDESGAKTVNVLIDEKTPVPPPPLRLVR